MRSLLLIGLLFISGCTAQERAKSFGGSMTQNLPPNSKLVNVTWKETQMWVLTRPMREDEEPETYSFKEVSAWGVLEGEVKLVESK